MTLSPPITTIALLAVGVADVTWFAPPQPQPPYVAVHLSAATFDKLEHWTKDRPSASGHLSESSKGTGWHCDRGYRSVGDACVALAVPENAHLDHSGNDWKCDTRYRVQQDDCIPS